MSLNQFDARGRRSDRSAWSSNNSIPQLGVNRALLLFMSCCVLGCARSADVSNVDGGSGSRPEVGNGHVKQSLGPSELSSAVNVLEFAERPGAEPVAVVRGRDVTLKSSRLTFRIPQSWRDQYDAPLPEMIQSMRKFATKSSDVDRDFGVKNNLHFTRRELDQARSGGESEWDSVFASIVNDMLQFDRCLFHGGGEGWGRQGHSFADVQMRIYLVPSEPTGISKTIAERAIAVVESTLGHASPNPTQPRELRGFTAMSKREKGRVEARALELENS